MYVCMYVCMFVCTYACMYICIYVCMHVCMYACMHACMQACMHACMYVCMYVFMHVCMHACTYACTYVRTYVCMRVFSTNETAELLNCEKIVYIILLSCGVASCWAKVYDFREGWTAFSSKKVSTENNTSSTIWRETIVIRILKECTYKKQINYT